MYFNIKVLLQKNISMQALNTKITLHFLGLISCMLLFQHCREEINEEPISKNPNEEPISKNPLVEFNQLTGKTSKTWKIRAVTINGVMQTLDDCQKSSEITFSKDKSGTIDYYDMSCGSKANVFSWELVPDTINFILANQEKHQLVVQELNETTLKYSTASDESLKYDFTLTAK